MTNATPAFPDGSQAQLSPLMEKIKSRIISSGQISFRNYMEMALYDQDHGYYANDTLRVGKEGDFITSVSIGPCFGMILARRLHAFWLNSGQSSAFHVIEPGAHDGSLCHDILTECQILDARFYNAIHYHLIDATTSLINAQQNKLGANFPGKFTSHQDFNKLHHLHGAVLSNELIDAFPVELIRYDQGQWWQLMVDLTPDQSLTLTPQKITDIEIEAFCKKIGHAFPDGYTTEYNADIAPFIRSVNQTLTSGLFITIDYGHSTQDYYHPDRTTGTLQTYYKHQKADDPLIAPGEIDITSHIDFTRLTAAAETHGFQNPSLRTQASYLTDHARTWLLDIENPGTSTPPNTPNLLRQFQTLIHPAMLGTKFTVLEMTKPQIGTPKETNVTSSL